MIELHDLAPSYDEALKKFEATIEDGRRQWAARLLREYPHRNFLEGEAESLRSDLAAKAVEINSLTAEHQTTIAKAPVSAPPVQIESGDSLCILTVATGEPAMVVDIVGDRFLEGHAATRSGLTSWASAPIMIEGVNAGSVCALEVDGPRHWSQEDQDRLEEAAEFIGQEVQAWLPQADKTRFL